MLWDATVFSILIVRGVGSWYLSQTWPQIETSLLQEKLEAVILWNNHMLHTLYKSILTKALAYNYITCYTLCHAPGTWPV